MGANDKLAATFHPGERPPFCRMEMLIEDNHPWFNLIAAKLTNVDVATFMRTRMFTKNSGDPTPHIWFESTMTVDGIEAQVWFVLDTREGVSAEYNGDSGFQFRCVFNCGAKPDLDAEQGYLWANLKNHNVEKDKK